MACLRRFPLVVIALAVCARGLPAQSPADTASVRAFYTAWFGPAQQDPVTYASFYAPDGYVLPPDSPPIQGREAIAEWQRRARAEATYTVRPEGIRVDEIRFLGRDWVVHRGTLWGQRAAEGGRRSGALRDQVLRPAPSARQRGVEGGLPNVERQSLKDGRGYV
jgi:uncharacterized protein (TIGR02246 family)